MNDVEVGASLGTRAAQAFRAYRDGDAQAMRTLVELVSPTLWHLTRSCGLDRRQAEDVVQTAFLRLVEHCDRITEPAAVLGWLCTTARHESWRVRRRRHREDELDATEDLPEVTPHDPAAVIELDEQCQALWAHVATLSPRCQQLLRVICTGDRPDYATLAEALGMPIGSIGPTRGRCLAALRKALLDDPLWRTS